MSDQPPEPDYKPVHERKTVLELSDVSGDDRQLGRLDTSDYNGFFNICHSHTAFTVRSPDAAREMAAQLWAWADHMESDNE